MRVMLIDDAVKEEIKRVRQWAESHEYTLAHLKEVMDGKRPGPGEYPDFTLAIQVGYKVVYTIENQKDGNKYRHMSVSVDAEDKLPSIESVLILLEEFGFKCKRVKDCDYTYIEDDIAINCMEKI